MSFAPNPRFPHLRVVARVTGYRPDARQTRNVARPGDGWVETRDQAGFERSVRPSRCTVTAAPGLPS